MAKLLLKNAEIVFANLVDEGFGTSLTIRVTPEIEKSISDFWASEKIGNEKTVVGVPNFKMYEETKQLALKVTPQTKFGYVNGTNSGSVGFGCGCDIILNSFEYNNKFTKSVTYIGCSLSAVLIVAGRKTGTDSDLAELLGSRESSDVTISETKSEIVSDDLPF